MNSDEETEYIHECTRCNRTFRASNINRTRHRAARHWNEDHDDLIRDMQVLSVEVIGGDYIDTPDGRIKQVREREVRLTPFDVLVEPNFYGSDSCDSYVVPSDDSRVCDFCGINMSSQSRVKYDKDATEDGNGYACEDCFEREDLSHDHRGGSEYETEQSIQRRARDAYRENENIEDVCGELDCHIKRARKILNDAGVQWHPEPSDDDATLSEFGGGA